MLSRVAWRSGWDEGPFCPFGIRSGLVTSRYEAALGGRPERLASGSDDFTMFLWEPSTSDKPLARMTGHLQLINHVRTHFVRPCKMRIWVAELVQQHMLPCIRAARLACVEESVCAVSEPGEKLRGAQSGFTHAWCAKQSRGGCSGVPVRASWHLVSWLEQRCRCSSRRMGAGWSARCSTRP